MLKGHVFQNQIFGNQIFALFVNTFLDGHNGIINGYKNSMSLTKSGSEITIASGALCVQGRFLEEDSSTTIDAGTNTAYCKLVLTINLDRENTSSNFAQGYYEILTGVNDYPSITQNNIVGTNEGKYQYELARFKTGLSGITNFVDKRTFLDFQSIYEELEQQSTLATKAELQAVNSNLSERINTKANTSTMNTELAKKLNLTGGTVTGTINSSDILPRTYNTYKIGNNTSALQSICTTHLYLNNGAGASSSWSKVITNEDIGQNNSKFKNAFLEKLHFGSHSDDKILTDGSNGWSVIQSAAGLTSRDINDYTIFNQMWASAFITSSSKRYKENIKDITEERANKILDVNVVTYDYKNKENGVDRTGVIAEDVLEIIPEVVTFLEDEETKEILPNGVDYSKFVPYLIKEVQILKKEIDELKGLRNE